MAEFKRWTFMSEHSPHWNWRLTLWRFEVHAEVWVNRYPRSSSRVCARVGGHYDRKHGEGYATTHTGGSEASPTTAGEA